MRPLLFISFVICYVAFLFNNNIIPVANLKMNTLKYDIIVSKPAFDIKEGVFYDKIEGYVIKIGKKEKDDSTIRSVVLYQQNYSGQQDDIIVAEKGKMVVTPDKHSLVFVLQNGWIYQEGKGDRMSTSTDFVRMGFKEYRKVLDLTSFKLNKTEDSAFRNNYQMLTMNQLGHNIDSLRKLNEFNRQRAATDLHTGLKFTQMLDTTGWAEVEKAPKIESRYLLAKPTTPYTPPSTAVTGTTPTAGPPAAAATPATANHPTAAVTPDSSKRGINHPDTSKRNTSHPDTSHLNINNSLASHRDTSKRDTGHAGINLRDVARIDSAHRDSLKAKTQLAKNTKP